MYFAGQPEALSPSPDLVSYCTLNGLAGAKHLAKKIAKAGGMVTEKQVKKLAKIKAKPKKMAKFTKAYNKAIAKQQGAAVQPTPTVPTPAPQPVQAPPPSASQTPTIYDPGIYQPQLTAPEASQAPVVIQTASPSSGGGGSWSNPDQSPGGFLDTIPPWVIVAGLGAVALMLNARKGRR